MTKLLVVDDDRVIIRQIEKFLTAIGHSYVALTNPQNVFVELEMETIDLILLDVYMPVLDGVTLLKQLKSHPLYQNIPVIMITGMEDKQLLAQSFEHGATDFINKPIDFLVFKARVQAALTTQAYIQKVEHQKTELLIHRNHLSDLVAKRTAKLTSINKQLKQEAIVRVEAEQKLKASLNEKDVLLKEIHHRVKNNLQIISSLLDLQSDYVNHEVASQMLKESQDRVRAIAFVHELLYQSEDLAHIDMRVYANTLIDYLLGSYGTDKSLISIELNIAAIFLSIEQAIPCGLIISELVSNALKHAFTDDKAGIIEVNFNQLNNDELKLEIKDDGVGFAEAVDLSQAKSLGLMLITMLVKQISGSIKFTNQNGTTFTIIFSKS